MRSAKILIASIATVLAAATSGCVSTKTVALDAGRLAPYSGKTIVLAKRPMPDFAVMTAGSIAVGAMFGAIGGAVAGAQGISTGNEMVREDHIEDPAIANGQALLAELAQRYDLTVKDEPGVVEGRGDPIDIAKPYPDADLILDVRSIGWEAIYFPENWTHYGVIYSAKLTLIDARTKASLAEAFCAQRPEKLPDSPNYDELVAEQGARLKALIGTASANCLAQLREKMNTPPAHKK